MQYFASNQSIGYYYAGTEDAIKTIARRYIGSHPAQPFSFRVISTDTFMQQGDDGRYIIDMGSKFPDAKLGQYAYAAAKIYTDELVSYNIAINCFGPVTIYLDSEEVYKSDCLHEVNNEVKTNIGLKLHAGENFIFIKMRKALSGFGCIFGVEYDTSLAKNYLSIFSERDGQAGFIYSAPTDEDVFKESFPDVSGSEKESPVKWYPIMDWADDNKYQCGRIFGVDSGKYAYGYTMLDTGFCMRRQKYTAAGSCAGESALWIGGVKIAEGLKGEFCVDFEIEYGVHNVIFETRSTDDDFGFRFDILNADNKKCCFVSPFNVKGTDNKWVYIGVFADDERPAHDELLCAHKIINGNYWRVDMPNAYIRPYVEIMRFGRWNYPLGVTVYGLYRAGKLLNNTEITNYAEAHMDLAVKYYNYALWDRDKYGYPSVDHKLIEMKMLDDCGSAGSAMLEIYADNKREEYLSIAHDIADYMKNKLERRPDGAFYRMQRTVHYKTLWADDLYMSVPFLCRYYLATGKTEYLDDAAKQFILFKKYLFMTENKLMSHVYDFKFDTPTYQPWGRANGWVMFSLTELLEKMPKEHELRKDIVAFFREMSEGVLAVQGKNGIWHQLLTDDTSYEEASCTSMFAYAFLRGIRFGLYEEADFKKYYSAAKRAWDGLRNIAVDKEGNVYGVCCGSRYSFMADYYTDSLSWVKNDYHGIGIVLLAGVEFKNMEGFFKD